MNRLIIVAEVSDECGNRKRWRCLFDGTETLHQIATRACAKEPHKQAYPGDAFRWFTMGGAFTEAEYTKEKEREVYAQLDRHKR
jgi:hypothetical protein